MTCDTMNLDICSIRSELRLEVIFYCSKKSEQCNKFDRNKNDFSKLIATKTPLTFDKRLFTKKVLRRPRYFQCIVLMQSIGALATSNKAKVFCDLL